MVIIHSNSTTNSSSHRELRHRRRRTSPVLASPLEDEDLLREILLRLPPQPCSLPRASLVCKLWCNIVSDTQFLKRFRKHHRKAPLLGFFVGDYFCTDPVFAPILDPPDRINSTRFAMPWSSSAERGWSFLNCRHGLVVLINKSQRKTIVWDPLTGQQHHTKFPRRLNNPILKYTWHGTVMCVDGEDGHVHGDCISSRFKLVLICVGYRKSSACFYDSASGVWGNVVSIPTTDMICSKRLGVLVGNSLYWLLSQANVLVFDFETQRFDVIDKPAAAHSTNYRYIQLLRTKDGGLGLAIFSEGNIELWEKKSNIDGVVGWVLLQKTIPLEGVFPLIPHEGMFRRKIYDRRFLLVGYDEDTNVIVLSTMIGNFMVQVDSMQIRHIVKRDCVCYDTFYPYTNFYTAGKAVGRKWMDLKL